MIVPGRGSLHAALDQARRYADKQHVARIAVSDGRYFYAADITSGGLEDRILVDLAHEHPPASALAAQHARHLPGVLRRERLHGPLRARTRYGIHRCIFNRSLAPSEIWVSRALFRVGSCYK